MPDSPPKRMTRARARAAESSTAPVKTTKVAIASAKATKTTARTTKRKSPADEADLDEAPTLEPPTETTEKSEPVKKTRGRPKKAVTTAAQPAQEDQAEPAKPAKSALKAPEAPKTTRGRPKKVVAAAEDDAAKPATTKVTTRKATRAHPVTPPKPTVKRKKVMFQDEQQDKENRVPSPELLQKKAVTKTTGIRARPIRRPAPTRTTRRGKKTAEEDGQTDGEAERPKPLSPKKATQVATGSSVSSEDELAGKKMPIGIVYKSPVKNASAANRGISELRLGSAAKPAQIPELGLMSASKPSIIASPARRPPTSPFKDTLKASPKRPDFGETLAQRSAIKAPASAAKPTLEAPVSTKKPSLLQSPARRPQASPAKPMLFGSHSKTNMGPPPLSAAQSSAQVNALAIRELSPRKNLISSFGAIRSPERAPKVAVRTPAKTPVAAVQTQPTVVESPHQAENDLGDAMLVDHTQDLGIETPSKTIASSDHALPPLPDSPSPVEEEADGTMVVEHTAKLVSPNKTPLPSPAKMIDIPILTKCHTPTPTRASSHEQSTTPAPMAEPEFVESVERMMKSSPLVATPAVPAHQSPAATLPAADGSDSEDELHTTKPEYTPTGMGSPRKVSIRDFASTPTPSVTTTTVLPKSTLRRQAAQGTLFDRTEKTPSAVQKAQVVTMTPLIRQLESWKASSPEKTDANIEHQAETPMGIFSYRPTLACPTDMATPSRAQEVSPSKTSRGAVEASPAKNTFFEDAISVPLPEDNDEDLVSTPATSFSAVSEASQEYGDENAVPIDPVLLAADRNTEASTATCTPARVFANGPRVIHTVSKVPLRPSAEANATSSPCVARPLRPANSLNAASPSRKHSKPDWASTPLAARSVEHEATTTAQHPSPTTTLTQAYTTPSKPASTVPITPASTIAWSTFGTPSATPRAAPNPGTLKGAIVFVDVHTTEGADASGIFVELLTQMGARCVKRWSWSAPRADGASPAEEPASRESSPGVFSPTGGKIGITHVVFKDGSPRTLEKVRDGHGVVLCVGVGWVLDCERENRWLDESAYSIDTSLVPRGGQRRRKSMEPRALSSLDGMVVPAATPGSRAATTTASAVPSEGAGVDLSPTKEFLTFSSPARRESTLFVKVASPDMSASPSTPAQDGSVAEPASVYSPAETDGGDSPSTPYFLHPAQLVQRTCPPKRQNGFAGEQEQQRGGEAKRLFPLTGRIEDQPDESVRMRLLAARRKSLQWAPRIGSPLGRGV